MSIVLLKISCGCSFSSSLLTFKTTFDSDSLDSGSSLSDSLIGLISTSGDFLALSTSLFDNGLDKMVSVDGFGVGGFGA